MDIAMAPVLITLPLIRANVTVVLPVLTPARMRYLPFPVKMVKQRRLSSRKCGKKYLSYVRVFRHAVITLKKLVRVSVKITQSVTRGK